jgi:hypothetical protein
MVRSIAGVVAAMTALVTACSVGLPENVDDYVRASGSAAAIVADAGQEPFSGALACSPELETDGGSAPLTTVWKAPGALHRGACTSAQADQLVHCVYDDPLHTTKACQDFLAAAENQTCITCGVTSRSEPVWGAIIEYSAQDFPRENVEGCVAALSGDASTNGCGAKLLAVQDCENYVCRACGPEADYNACADVADGTLCASFAAAAACSVPYMEQCWPNGLGPVEAGRHLVKLFCER